MGCLFLGVILGEGIGGAVVSSGIQLKICHKIRTDIRVFWFSNWYFKKKKGKENNGTIQKKD